MMNASRPILLIRLSSEIPTLLTKYSLQEVQVKFEFFPSYRTEEAVLVTLSALRPKIFGASRDR